MKTVDLYSLLRTSLQSSWKGYEVFQTPELRFFAAQARSWEMDRKSIEAWFNSPEAKAQEVTATTYLQKAHAIVSEIETVFRKTLPGTLVWMPSFGEFDGFARYDSGEHLVLLGIDFPDADVNYLKALTAHELSHVYRDHAPEVWGHLGSPLIKISRKMYLEANTAQEHLVSEGLATLFSSVLYPDIPSATHHYYEEAEWEWCLANSERIHSSISQTLREDADVWSYYGSGRAGSGSPSRTQYYWAAKLLKLRLEGSREPLAELVKLHEKPASFFTEFKRVNQ